MIKLTDSIIGAGTSPKVFERGESLYETDAIFNLAVQDTFLFGDCEGTEMPFYHIKVELDEHGIRSDYCSCPYDDGGYCKHTVAVLLAYAHEPEKFTIRQSPQELLASQTKEQLFDLVAKLLQEKPELYEWFATKIDIQNIVSKKSKPKERKKIDIEPHRRRVRSILHSLDGMRHSEAYWYVGGVANQLREVEKTALEFLKIGEAEAACRILLTIFEEGYDCFEYLDDSNGEMGDFFNQVAKTFAEALLSLETDEERKEFVTEIEDVNSDLSDYGVDGLSIAIFAAKYGWGGSFDEDDFAEEWEDDWVDDPDYDDSSEYFHELTEIKLNILERQERTDDFLKLALENRQYLRYAQKLGELGQIEKAVEYALQNFDSPTDALDLGKVLREADHFDESLQIAEKGLTLEGKKAALGEWLAPIEESLGRTEMALEAWTGVFVEKPSLQIYLKIQELSAENWLNLKPQLMEAMEKSYSQVPLAEVLLLEEKWDEAVTLGEKRNNVYWGEVTELIADRVVKHRPEWVIKIGRKNFDELVRETKSKYYPKAVKWLKKAKLAYLEMGKTDEWNKYWGEIKETYKRRPSLQNELKSL